MLRIIILCAAFQTFIIHGLSKPDSSSQTSTNNGTNLNYTDINPKDSSGSNNNNVEVKVIKSVLSLNETDKPVNTTLRKKRNFDVLIEKQSNNTNGNKHHSDEQKSPSDIKSTNKRHSPRKPRKFTTIGGRKPRLQKSLKHNLTDIVKKLKTVINDIVKKLQNVINDLGHQTFEKHESNDKYVLRIKRYIQNSTTEHKTTVNAAVESTTDQVANATEKPCDIVKSGRRFMNGDETANEIRQKLLDYIKESFDDIKKSIEPLDSIKTAFADADGFQVGYIVANIDSLVLNLDNLENDLENNKNTWDDKKIINVYDKLKACNNVVSNLIIKLQTILSNAYINVNARNKRQHV